MPAERRLKNADQPATARVFFALWPSSELADALAGVAHDAAARFGGRPARRDTIHLTLAFLGDVPVSKLPDLCTLGRRLQADAFELSIDRIGYWAHNRLLWAGCSAIPEGLSAVQQRLQVLLSEGGYPFDSPNRRFTPHITLVRKLALAESPVFLPLPAQSWPCASFVLVQSNLTPDGPNYRVIETFPLRQPA